MKILRLSMKLVLAASLLVSACFAQEPELDRARLRKLTVAVARAEGFGVRHAIPTRYHNPGDLKANPCPVLGQTCKVKGVGKGGHIIFASDADGWRALEAQITLIITGQSKHYAPNTNLRQIARTYAARWRRWLNGVTKYLDVPADTLVADYVGYMPPPPVVTVPLSPDVLTDILRLPVLGNHDQPTPVLGKGAAEEVSALEHPPVVR